MNTERMIARKGIEKNQGIITAVVAGRAAMIALTITHTTITIITTSIDTAAAEARVAAAEAARAIDIE